MSDTRFRGLKGEEAFDLFASAEELRASARARLVRELVPIARRLLEAGGDVTVDHLRAEALALGLITGAETGRYLSFLAGVFRKAGGAPVGYTKSSTPSRHGAVVAIWRLANCRTL